MANKFSRIIEGPSFKARSLQEALAVPMMLREQHDETINAASENLKKARNAEIDHRYQDEFNAYLDNLDKDVSNLINNINTSGINANSSLEDFSAMKRRLDADFSNTGDIGRAINMRKTISEKNEEAIKHAVAMGQSPELAREWANKDLENYYANTPSSLAGLGRASLPDYNPTLAPKYTDYTSELTKVAGYLGKIRSVAKKQELQEGSLRIQNGVLVGNDMTTGMTKKVSMSNEQNLEFAVKYITDMAKNPNSPIGQNLIYSGVDPEELGSGLFNLAMSMVTTDSEEEDIEDTARSRGTGLGKGVGTSNSKDNKGTTDPNNKLLRKAPAGGYKATKASSLAATQRDIEEKIFNGTASPEDYQAYNEVARDAMLYEEQIKIRAKGMLDSQGKLSPKYAKEAKDMRNKAVNLKGNRAAYDLASSIFNINDVRNNPLNSFIGSSSVGAASKMKALVNTDAGYEGDENSIASNVRNHLKMLDITNNSMGGNNTIVGVKDDNIVLSTADGNIGLSVEELNTVNKAIMQGQSAGDALYAVLGDDYENRKVDSFTAKGPLDILTDFTTKEIKTHLKGNSSDLVIAEELARAELGAKDIATTGQVYYISDWGSSSNNADNTFFRNSGTEFIDLITNGSGGGTFAYIKDGKSGNITMSDIRESTDFFDGVKGLSNLTTRITSFKSTGDDVLATYEFQGVDEGNKAVKVVIDAPLRADNGKMYDTTAALLDDMYNATSNEEDREMINTIRNEVVTRVPNMVIGNNDNTVLVPGSQTAIVRQAANQFSGYAGNMAPNGYEGTSNSRIPRVRLDASDYPFVNPNVDRMDHTTALIDGKHYYTTRYGEKGSNDTKYMELKNIINNRSKRILHSSGGRTDNPLLQALSNKQALDNFASLYGSEIRALDAYGDTKYNTAMSNYLTTIDHLDKSGVVPNSPQHLEMLNRIISTFMQEIDGINIGSTNKTYFY